MPAPGSKVGYKCVANLAQIDGWCFVQQVSSTASNWIPFMLALYFAYGTHELEDLDRGLGCSHICSISSSAQHARHCDHFHCFFNCVLVWFLKMLFYSRIQNEFLSRCEPHQPKAVENNVPKDCLECRVAGFVTLSGISGYFAYLRMNTPVYDKKQKLFLGCLSAGW